ncbi:MAG: 5-methyltetrahydropteroyltriglutamate--homocysteine S-methyltransferase [Thermaceae bacterium]
MTVDSLSGKRRETIQVRTYAYGYPRLDPKRQYKTLVEGFWKGKVSGEELRQGLEEVERERIQTYQAFVDGFPIGEFSLYDPMLDTALLLGVPEGAEEILEGVGSWSPEGLSAYFALARGEKAWPLRKWFNTNYHYLVPELPPGGNPFRAPSGWKGLWGSSPYPSQGLPYLIGPYTFLRLSKERGREDPLPEGRFRELWEGIIPAYAALLRGFKEKGVPIHVDEPAWVLDVPEEHLSLILEGYRALAQEAELLVFTYYAGVDFLEKILDLPLKGLGLDLVHGGENLEVLRRLEVPKDKILVAGVVDGRNVWKTDLDQVARLVEDLAQKGAEIWLSNAAPLYHLPVSLEGEDGLPPALRERLAFAKERLRELRLLKGLLLGEEAEEIKTYNAYHHSTEAWRRPEVVQKVQALREEDFQREKPYEERKKLQEERLHLPLFPTTTIGSFPQTEEFRRARALRRSGRISEEEYKAMVREKIREAIRIQEELGLDVLVHGEFERSDMVEFFAERLEGFAFTKAGWVLSYGTRVYRPPILYGDVHRPRPMTLEEILYAQSLTQKPVKGMLTGPITLMAWSYVRQDIPPWEVAYQLALAIQAEVRDLEEAGIQVVQIDEPAFREFAPLKRRDWPRYFEWATKAFRLASRARPETQVHTHMCYSEFGEVLEYVDHLGADVISIEAARSKGGLLEPLRAYPRPVGPGVYDVHSPAIPEVEEMEAILRRALGSIPRENLWVNPDCGLKTRNWEEVVPALRNMVAAAQRLRTEKD